MGSIASRHNLCARGTISFNDIEGAPLGVIVGLSFIGIKAISTKGPGIFGTVRGAKFLSWLIFDDDKAILITCYLYSKLYDY